MAEIEIDGEDYVAYSDVETADLYLGGSINATIWFDLSEDDKGRNLVTATRIMDRQKWQPDYDTFEEREVVDEIVNASIELANSLANGADVENEANTGQKIASLGAGTARIEYFRGAEGAALRFPLIVHELLGKYLYGTFTNFGGSVSFGTCGEPASKKDYGFSGPI